MAEAAASAHAFGRLRMGVLAIDGCMLSSIACAADTLRVAQRLAEIRNPVSAPRLETVICSARGSERVSMSTGLEMSGVVPIPEDLDVLLIPGLMHSSPQHLHDRCIELQPEIDAIRRLQARGVRIAASCSGTFLLAQAGLLDGRRTTTSWWLAAAFRHYYPRVLLDAERMLIDDDGVISTGGATAVLTLALRLIGEYAGETLAMQTSRMMNFDADRQSQAPYVSLAMMERPRSSMTERAERFLQTSLHADISVSGLAEHCGTSERSLLRHFRAHYGATPLEHIQRLRVERAKALLETTLLSFEEIMERCGYSDVSSFRKLFKRATTLTPANYRERFRLRAP
jgi:transcriptional regulator GlxA family with amidase domain